MHSSTALGIFASLYRRCDKEDWIDATEHDTWQDFLKTVCPTIEIISLPDDLSADDQNNEVVRDTNQLDTKSYHELKKQYPNETYEQGPLMALYELNARFC